MTDEETLRAEEEATINEFVRLREESGQSQKKLAESVGMKQQVVGRIEKKLSSPQLHTFMKLLKPLGYTIAIVPRKD